MAGFQELLHAWAAHQLETRSSHAGSQFTIEAVRVDSVCGYSVESDYLEVGISFSHSGCSLIHYDGARCGGKAHWSMPDTTDSVTMLNQLLALGDAKPVNDEEPPAANPEG